MFAIIETGGKQYRAEPGAKLRVEKLEAEAGQTVEFDALLLGGEKTVVGNPTVPGAKVVAEVVGHGKGRKILVMKFKAKVQYRRKRGHRQPYTEIVVKEIRA
ncbi:50S ribosomal protein L21 [Calidithermus roseus]|uniref:Large ribosomal subunit protein bL21 n=1 Tax=Calidithermus roseus TaxID=1644118 RepID=A0A399EMY4_9DEIN|nr:50S ribosomal protein L21 [Calidithermus roseus]RIH85987.1 50S ribosomal protein L21 [Calidithermus roseus]